MLFSFEGHALMDGKLGWRLAGRHGLFIAVSARH